MNKKAVIKTFFSSTILSILVFLLSFVAVDGVFAANPQFNFMSNDMETLVVGNWTTSGGTTNWADPISASAGDRVAFDIYYHNGVEGTTATNTMIKISYPTAAASQIVTTGYIWADNAAQVSDKGTINISSSQTITFENTALWYPNQTATNPTSLSVTNSGSYAEVNIGSIVGGWATQGHVVFYANISKNLPPSNPVVDAGPNKDINENQTAVLNGSATDPQGYPMTYSWSCNGGTLSSSTVLTPTYTAPSVTSDTTYTCTLTATDSHGNSGSDSVNVLVRNIAVSTTPVVDAGQDRSLGENQSIVLIGSATNPQGYPMTYSWSCNDGGLTNSNTLTPTYTAPSVTSDTTYTCTLTATDSHGNTSSDSAAITVINSTPGSTSSGSGSGNPMVNVSLAATPASGPVPLQGVDLAATAYIEGISSQRLITYSFDCSNDNSWELSIETTDRNYVAQDLCNYSNSGTYTAKVKIEVAGYEAYNQTTIIVGSGGSVYGISAEAGPNKDIFENQSVELNGSAYSQYGYSTTCYWSCNGGSLSNSTTLNPTYYAPSVDADTTYACTLYVTDVRGYKNSDTVSITVRSTTDSGLKVTTESPESVTSSSAVLKGTVNNDGGQYTSVRFDWGKLSAYNNYTLWISNKTTGQSFNYYISGLEKGKAYHYKVESSNGKEIVVGQDVSFVTKPDAPTRFTATGISPNQISLDWNTGAASCYTMVVRKTGGYPVNSSDGATVYYGTGNSFVDTNLSSGVWYYYRAWSVACDEGLNSFSVGQNAKAYVVATGQNVVSVGKLETGAAVEALGRDATQNEIAWQNIITSSPNDEIEFKVIITPTGGKSLEDVVLRSTLSDKIGSISGIKVDEDNYNGSLSGDIKLGTIALGESKIITFKGTVADKNSFAYGSNELSNAFDISANDITSITKNVNISVSRGVEATAGLISFIDWRVYSWILTALLLILCIIMMYLLIERKRGKECLTEKASASKVEKSKYFNIK